MDSVRDAGGFGITVSYSTSQEAITEWKTQAEHQVPPEGGKKTWSADYHLRVAWVERACGRSEPGALSGADGAAGCYREARVFRFEFISV